MQLDNHRRIRQFVKEKDAIWDNSWKLLCQTVTKALDVVEQEPTIPIVERVDIKRKIALKRRTRKRTKRWRRNVIDVKNQGIFKDIVQREEEIEIGRAHV